MGSHQQSRVHQVRRAAEVAGSRVAGITGELEASLSGWEIAAVRHAGGVGRREKDIVSPRATAVRYERRWQRGRVGRGADSVELSFGPPGPVDAVPYGEVEVPRHHLEEGDFPIGGVVAGVSGPDLVAGSVGRLNRGCVG